MGERQAATSRPPEVARNDAKPPRRRAGSQVGCCRERGFGRMPHYRAYFLDEHGELGGAVNLHCPDDASATERAGRLASGHEVQLWRLVAELKLEGPPRSKPRRRIRAVH
jgi:hypothetical protein